MKALQRKSLSFALVRAVRFAVLLFVLHAVLFALFRLLPSGLGAMFGWGSLDPTFRASVAEELGMDRPWPEQYARHLRSIVRMDLGNTSRGRFPVADVLRNGFLTSLPLFAAVSVGAVLGPFVALAMYVSDRRIMRRRESWIQAGAINLPPFVIAAAAYALYQWMVRFSGWGGQTLVFWTAVVLSCGLFPLVVTYAMAARAIGSLKAMFFYQTLIAMGYSARDLRRCLRPMVLSVIRPGLARVVMGGVLSTSFVELLFGIPGFGRLGLRALQDADFALMFGWTLAAALAVLALSEVEQWSVHRY